MLARLCIHTHCGATSQTHSSTHNQTLCACPPGQAWVGSNCLNKVNGHCWCYKGLGAAQEGKCKKVTEADCPAKKLGGGSIAAIVICPLLALYGIWYWRTHNRREGSGYTAAP